MGWYPVECEHGYDCCPVCDGSRRDPLTLKIIDHDHKPDGSGIDDGPPLPGCAPRKRLAPKPADEVRSIRAQAWETRRAKYGKHGHR